MNTVKRMKELTELLNEAAKAYYQEDREIMSNYDYDRLYDELAALEQSSGITLSGSPTMRVGYELLSELPKEAHQSPMLSLDKTKDTAALQEWLGEQEGLLSWKLDGLTIVLTYENGQLVKAVTRGNGEVGEVITNNARVFANIPLTIAFQGRLVLRGEAVIPYSSFRRINQEIEDAEARYKNPRNLCSGSVRQLNNEITARRDVHFYAFSLVDAEGIDFENSREKQLLWLQSQGFETVAYRRVSRDTAAEAVRAFSDEVETQDVPSDGLVLIFDDIAYGQSLGRTAKFPRDSIAFKWADDTEETTLHYIEWSASRTGLINPVAVFEPVEIEGSTVSRASVHNISILESLELGSGDKITVYKANMIIPQISENLTRSGVDEIPDHCPVCGEKTEIRAVNDVKALYCVNEACPAKKLKSFALFASRDAMNIDGLSEATLEKFIGCGFIHDFTDLFHLERHQEAIVAMEGFGEKSYRNLIASVEKARDTQLWRLIYALGIANIGPANAKMLCRAFKNDVERLTHATVEEFTAIDGIGEVIAEGIVSHFAKEANRDLLSGLLKEVRIAPEDFSDEEKQLTGKVFVITGSLEHFENRDQLKTLIEDAGGKVTGSVTKKTSYLINNDVTSSSSKNKKARDLNIPILSEKDFLEMTGIRP